MSRCTMIAKRSVSSVSARSSVKCAKTIAQATDALLAAGALRHAVTRIAREAEFGSFAVAA